MVQKGGKGMKEREKGERKIGRRWRDGGGKRGRRRRGKREGRGRRKSLDEGRE